MSAAVKAFYWLLGIGSLFNGLWMLATPAGWFSDVPAAVTDTGPLNAHLVHDLGVVFLIIGFGSIWCARRLERSWHVHLGIVLFYAGHALVHVVEISEGALPPAHWLIDAPLTFLPALLLVAISLPPLSAVFREAG